MGVDRREVKSRKGKREEGQEGLRLRLRITPMDWRVQRGVRGRFSCCVVVLSSVARRSANHADRQNASAGVSSQQKRTSGCPTTNH